MRLYQGNYINLISPVLPLNIFSSSSLSFFLTVFASFFIIINKKRATYKCYSLSLSLPLPWSKPNLIQSQSTYLDCSYFTLAFPTSSSPSYLLSILNLSLHHHYHHYHHLHHQISNECKSLLLLSLLLCNKTISSTCINILTVDVNFI